MWVPHLYFLLLFICLFTDSDDFLALDLVDLALDLADLLSTLHTDKHGDSVDRTACFSQYPIFHVSCLQPLMCMHTVTSLWFFKFALVLKTEFLHVMHAQGVAGGVWFAAGAVIQIFFFGIVAVEIKRRAPTAHTVLEIVAIRWGNKARVVSPNICSHCCSCYLLGLPALQILHSALARCYKQLQRCLFESGTFRIESPMSTMLTVFLLTTHATHRNLQNTSVQTSICLCKWTRHVCL